MCNNSGGTVLSGYRAIGSASVNTMSRTVQSGSYALGSTTVSAPSACDNSGETVLSGYRAMGSASVNTTSGTESGSYALGSTTLPLRDKKKTAYTKAPHRIINLSNLQSTMNQFLGKCPTCKGILTLEEKYTVSFSTALEIVCLKCIEK